MPQSLRQVVTPERLLVREQASEAEVPAANGYVGILPGHAALLAELAALNRARFGDLLGHRGLPRHYGDEDLTQDASYARGE